MKAAAIIVAAGASRRFGAKTAKQFVSLYGKPLFLWSLLTFKKIKHIKQLILVVPKNKLKTLSNLQKKYGVELATGGKKRIDSVRSGLKKVQKDIDYIAIHDAARPLIKLKTIKHGLKKAKRYKAVVTAVPSTDTVKISASNLQIQKTIPRNTVWLAQTPQIFHRSIILKSYDKVKNKKVTDDAQIAELAGYRVKIVHGDYNNIKITNKEDLKRIKSILKN